MLTGGKRPPHMPKGFFVEPTIFHGHKIQDTTVWREEARPWPCHLCQQSVGVACHSRGVATPCGQRARLCHALQACAVQLVHGPAWSLPAALSGGHVSRACAVTRNAAGLSPGRMRRGCGDLTRGWGAGVRSRAGGGHLQHGGGGGQDQQRHRVRPGSCCHLQRQGGGLLQCWVHRAEHRCRLQRAERWGAEDGPGAAVIPNGRGGGLLECRAIRVWAAQLQCAQQLGSHGLPAGSTSPQAPPASNSHVSRSGVRHRQVSLNSKTGIRRQAKAAGHKDSNRHQAPGMTGSSRPALLSTKDRPRSCGCLWLLTVQPCLQSPGEQDHLVDKTIW